MRAIPFQLHGEIPERIGIPPWSFADEFVSGSVVTVGADHDVADRVHSHSVEGLAPRAF